MGCRAGRCLSTSILLQRLWDGDADVGPRARWCIAHPLRLHSQPPALPSLQLSQAQLASCGRRAALLPPHPESDCSRGAGARPPAAGVRESAENGRTTRIMSSLGRQAAPGRASRPGPGKRVPCLCVRSNAAVRRIAKLSSCSALKAIAGSAEQVPVPGRSGDRQVRLRAVYSIDKVLGLSWRKRSAISSQTWAPLRR